MSPQFKALNQHLQDLYTQLNWNLREAQSFYFSTFIAISSLSNIVTALNPTSFHPDSSLFLTTLALLSHLEGFVEELWTLPKEINMAFWQFVHLLVNYTVSQLLDHPDLLGEEALVNYLYGLKRIHQHYPTADSLHKF